jgi:hypothetical protein
MQTFHRSDLTEIAADQIHVGTLLALPTGDQHYRVTAIDQVGKNSKRVTVHYDLPLGVAWKPTMHPQMHIERIDLTTGVPAILVRQSFEANEPVLILDNGWEKLFSPPTLFVIGAQELSEEQQRLIEQEAHTRFEKITFLAVPKIYGRLKQEVQDQVELGEQAYLYIDWFGLHTQAIEINEEQLASWLDDAQLRETYKTNRAIQFPEACVHVACFLAEKTRKIPVVIGMMRGSENQPYVKACFPDPI